MSISAGCELGVTAAVAPRDDQLTLDLLGLLAQLALEQPESHRMLLLLMESLVYKK